MTRTAHVMFTDAGLLNDPAGLMFERMVGELLRSAAESPAEVVSLALDVIAETTEGARATAYPDYAEELAEKAGRLAQLVMEMLRVEVDIREGHSLALGRDTAHATIRQGPQATARARPLATLLVASKTLAGYQVQLFDGWTGEHPPEKILRGIGHRLHRQALEGWLPDFGPGGLAALQWPG